MVLEPRRKPLDCLLDVIEAYGRQALVRGAKEYGDAWITNCQDRKTLAENAKWMVDVHIQAKLAAMVQAYDKQNEETALEQIGSAIGYMAVMLAQNEVIKQREGL
jgi:protein-L-isoaspartate O-methyltransferase